MKIVAAAVLLAWFVSGDPLIMASVLVLGLIWTVVRTQEGPPVIALALSFQWLSVTVGLFYVAITGRPLEATIKSDYRPMVAIGLGCVLGLTAGVYAGRRLIDRLGPPTDARPEHAWSLNSMLVVYAISVAVFGTVIRMAWDFPSITQAIIALAYIRLALLYLVLRRLVHMGRWLWMAGLVGVEIVIGISGFYAGFREPLMMASLALLEVFDRRSVRHWTTAAVLTAMMCVLGVVWVSVRTGYRERFATDEGFAASRSQRIDEIGALARGLALSDSAELSTNVDRFVERLWVIYYPALAVARVPSVLPHTGGRLMSEALQHNFMPRVFFPDKPELGSDSEMVRKYSGVMVAGAAQNTSIAFGYAAESYVDFGVPLMFVPMVVYGLFMGVCYAGLMRVIRHRDVAVSVVTMICWLSLYLFERSWVKTIGFAGSLLIYVGGLAIILDRFWYERFLTTLPSGWTPRAQSDPNPDASATAAYWRHK